MRTNWQSLFHDDEELKRRWLETLKEPLSIKDSIVAWDLCPSLAKLLKMNYEIHDWQCYIDCLRHLPVGVEPGSIMLHLWSCYQQHQGADASDIVASYLWHIIAERETVFMKTILLDVSPEAAILSYKDGIYSMFDAVPAPIAGTTERRNLSYKLLEKYEAASKL